MVLNKISRDLLRKPEIMPIVAIVSFATAMGSVTLVRTIRERVLDDKADKAGFRG